MKLHPETTTDDALKSVGKLTKLKELHLTACKITSKGIAHLEPLKNLVVLDLHRTEIDDEAMKIVAKFDKLEELDISETHISDFGIAHLYQHEMLRKLTIGSGSGDKAKLITDDSIGALSNIKSLRWLYGTEGTSLSDLQTLHQAIPKCIIFGTGFGDD